MTQYRVYACEESGLQRLYFHGFHILHQLLLESFLLLIVEITWHEGVARHPKGRNRQSLQPPQSMAGRRPRHHPSFDCSFEGVSNPLSTSKEHCCQLLMNSKRNYIYSRTSIQLFRLFHLQKVHPPSFISTTQLKT
jgi:hypothetical protein